MIRTIVRKILNIRLTHILAFVSVVLMGLLAGNCAISGTLAAKLDNEVTLSPYNDYPILEKGESYDRLINGGCNAVSNDPSIAEAELCEDSLRVTGVAAGTVTVVVTSSVGLALPYGYQICDSSLIGAYRMKNGGQVYFTGVNKSMTSPFIAEPYSAQDTVRWQSGDTDVATVSEDGTITAVGKGNTVIFGTFTDKWNIERNVYILVGVGLPAQTSDFGDGYADESDLGAVDDGGREQNEMSAAHADPGPPMDDKTFTALMTEAQKHLGKPYAYGAKGPDKFDCSGFVCWSLSHSGIKQIQAHAQGVYQACTPIAREDARPGDLVFFTKTYDTWRTVTHVGIYVGDNMMLHAGNPVKYTNIGTPYWNNHFYGFGRITG